MMNEQNHELFKIGKESMTETVGQDTDSSLQARQRERAQRILAVAADLMLRWGYKRVTIDDIARQSGIGTGTIYLHWKTREALFEAVMLRETIILWRTLLKRIQSDPAEVLLHRMMRATLLNVMSRPLMRAVLTGDNELLGKLAQSEITQRVRQFAPAKQYVLKLRDLGLMRTDMDPSLQLYAFSATVTGFCLAGTLRENEDHLSLEEQAEALAQTIQRAFEPETLPSPETLCEVVAPWMFQYLKQVCDYCEQQVQERMVS
jgi:AcrR family transcriptional regulator